MPYVYHLKQFFHMLKERYCDFIFIFFYDFIHFKHNRIHFLISRPEPKLIRCQT